MWDLLGDRLRDRIEEIFGRNEITPGIAAPEIEEINVGVQSLAANVSSLNAAVDALGIGAEELAPGDFEVGFLIPRGAVRNELQALGNEFEELDGIIKPFLELSEGRVPNLEVRSISSSEFQLFLVALPSLALTMSKVVESLLTSYERIRNIRAKASSLEEEDAVPAQLIDELREHASGRMEQDIQALAHEVVGQAMDRIPEGRQYELQIEVTRSLRRLANRVDDGYSIEVRSFVPPDEEDEHTEAWDDVAEEEIEAAQAITERQPRMRRMNLNGRPILELPEGDDSEEAAGEDDAEPS